MIAFTPVGNQQLNIFTREAEKAVCAELNDSITHDGARNHHDNESLNVHYNRSVTSSNLGSRADGQVSASHRADCLFPGVTVFFLRSAGYRNSSQQLHRTAY